MTPSNPSSLAERLADWVDQAGRLEQDRRRCTEALALRRRAYEAAPDQPTLAGGYATALCRCGYLERGLDLFEQSLQRHPDDWALRLSYVVWLPYSTRGDRACLAHHVRRVGRSLPRPPQVPPVLRDPDPDRALRVGILSADFVENSPMAFYAEAWRCVDPDAMRLVAYSNAPHEDAGTAAYRKIFAEFHPINTLSDAQLADRIRADRIDVLVAFGGFVRGHRLGVLLYRPAPLQIDLGSVTPLGLPEVDVRVTDSWVDPEGVEPYYTEKLSRLDAGMACFVPPSLSPCVGPLPMLERGYVTFGAFNNPTKITPVTLSMWGRVLRALPSSRLLLKAPALDDLGLRDRLRQRFAEHGIGSERLVFQGATEAMTHLDWIGQADLHLDCYPFNGSRTTPEALWMGVPTVTLRGDDYVSRVGFEILDRLNLGVFVADSPDQYVEKVIAFTRQTRELAQIRRGLRGVLLNSSLCDPQAYGRQWETLVRRLWRGRLQEARAGRGDVQFLDGRSVSGSDQEAPAALSGGGHDIC